MEVLMSRKSLSGSSRRLGKITLAAVLTVSGMAGIAEAQAKPLSPDDKAAMALTAAKSAYNEKNYPIAAERFKAFLKDFGGSKQANAARYGLGVILIEGPTPDFKAAIEDLRPASTDANLPERPYALYYLGLALRGIGNQVMDQANAKTPAEGAGLRQQANAQYEQASQQFASAATLFAAGIKPGATATTEGEWATRARCDQAEMLLRIGKNKEALAALEPVLNSPQLAQSRYKSLAHFLQGYGAFASEDYRTAMRALSELSPFNEPVIGIQAHYLLARTHQLAGERPEAATQYEAVLASYEKDKKLAQAAMKNPAKLSFEEKTRFEALLKETPDYVLRTPYYFAELLVEQNKLPDAAAKFTQFIQANPKSAILNDAKLRLGICQVQLKQANEAIRVLTPLAEDAQLGDQALLWLGRAKVASADPANPQQTMQSYNQAIEVFHRAAAKAAAAPKDAQAQSRRLEIMMELGDTHQLAHQYKDAGAVYAKVLSENSPEWNEAALEHQAVALHLGKQYKESDEACVKFIQTYPKSQSAPEVLFRHAENAYLLAVTPGGDENARKAMYGQAIERYQQLLAKYPDFPQLSSAKLSEATCQYQLGKFEEAGKILDTIPEGDRTGELASVPYLYADCLLRTLPPGGDDAISMARLTEQLESSIKLLTTFVSANEAAPQVPDALVKLGFSYQRMAMILAEPAEKQKAFAAARGHYLRVVSKYPNTPVFPVAVYENAKCIAAMGDPGTAINQLARFQNDPLRKAPIAPMALLRLSEFMRQQHKAPEAVTLLQKVRAQYEPELLKDPGRADWVAQIQLGEGLALKDANKPVEARAIFEAVVKNFPGKPEAIEAAWRAGQTHRDEVALKLDAARKVLDAVNKPEELAPAVAGVNTNLATLRQIADAFQTQADAAAKAENTDQQIRMLYEAAWTNRKVAEGEVDVARSALQQEASKKAQERLAHEGPGVQPTQAHAPEVALAAVPLQPAENKVREQYRKLLDVNADAALANDARLELAEVLASRNDNDGAIKLLKEALEKENPIEMTEKLKLRLGACFLAKKDAAKALAQFDSIYQNKQSAFGPQARAAMGECYALQNNWQLVAEKLIRFRDTEQYKNIAGTSDRAMLLLGQAYTQLGQWEPARQTYETLVNRFPNSPWATEGRFGLGMALQNLKQFDPAIRAYTEVVNRTGSEIGARALHQIGLCKLEEKKYPEAASALLTVVFTYDYPELAASSRCEAAQALLAMQKPAEARAQLERVVKENPSGHWFDLAQKRLSEIK
jgi:TolA-binding protein